MTVDLMADQWHWIALDSTAVPNKAVTESILSFALLKHMEIRLSPHRRPV